MKKLLLVLLCSIFLMGCSRIYVDQTYDLVQIGLGSNSSINGTFFLGCGSVSGGTETHYYFYTKNDKGAISLRRIYYSRVTIYYTKDNPKAIFHFTTTTEHEYKGMEKEDANELMSNYGSWHYTWDIYIPEGSIINNYNVNIK
jgi:hypothetical protein